MKSAFHFIVFLAAFASLAGASYLILEVQPSLESRLKAVEGNTALVTVDEDGGAAGSNSDLGTIEALRTRVAELENEVSALRNTQNQVRTLQDRVDQVEETTGTLVESGGAAPAASSSNPAAPSAGGSNASLENVPSDVIREQLDALLEQREEEQQAQRDAERQERIQEMSNRALEARGQQLANIEERLVSEAFVNPATASQISSVMQNYDATLAELNKRMYGEDAVIFPGGSIFGGNRGGRGGPGVFMMAGRTFGGSDEQELGMSQEEYNTAREQAQQSAQESISSLLTEEQLDQFQEIERSAGRDLMGAAFGGGGRGGRGGN